MPVRTVTVRLRADIAQYTRSLSQASDRTSRLAGAGAKVGAVMVAGFAAAAASAAKFDKAMSNVRAVTNGTSKQMAALRSAALEAGKSTQYSATQAADAEAELARAGISVADITGGALKGALSLAAAGQMDLADSATIAAQTMNVFGLHGKDVTHIADVLAAGAGKSAANMDGLGMALRQGGLLAKQTGLSLEDTVGTLAAFADNTLVGSDAGTSLKTMLQRLVPQSDEARAMMDKLGFSAYDSQGKFVGLSKLAGNLQSSFKNLTPEARNAAFATIFGSDAVRAATTLYELGAKGIDTYVKAVDDQGAAARIAAIQTDNLAGDFERLKGALETALIEGGSSANGALRDMVKWVTKVVDAYNNLPPSVQHAVTLFSGIGGASLIAVAGILLLLPRIAATRTALTELGITAARTRTLMLGLGRLSIVVAGLEAINLGTEALMSVFDEAPPNVTRMGNSLLHLGQQGKAAGELTKTFGKDLDGFGEAVARIAHPGVLDRVGDSLYTITHLGSDSYDLDQAREQLNAVDEALAALVEGGASDSAAAAFRRMATEAEAQGTSTDKLRTLLPKYGDALTAADTQAGAAAETQAKLGTEAGVTADALQDQRTEAEKLSEALDTLNGTNISVGEREISFRQSLADLTQAVDDNGHSLDVTTEKGQKVKGAFLDAAKAAMEHAQAVAEQKNSQEAGRKVLEDDIGALRAQMKAAGFSKDAINGLTAAYLQLPPTATTKVDAKTQAAITDLEAVKAKIKSTKGTTITMRAPTKEARAQLEALGFKIKATKGKNVVITAPTGAPKRNVDMLAAAIRALQDKDVTVSVTRRTIWESVVRGGGSSQAAKNAVETSSAHGGLLPRYAAGGDVQIAPTGLLSGPGTGTSDSILALFASGAAAHVSNTEFVVNAVATKKHLPLLKAINAGKLASGGLAGFTYTPTVTAPSLHGMTDPMQRYTQEVQDLRDAWSDLRSAVSDQKKAASELAKAQKELSKAKTASDRASARKDVAEAKAEKKKADAAVKKATAARNAADKELGLRAGAKVPTKFNLNAYVTQLDESLGETTRWRNNLAKITKRGGKDVAAMLEAMGEDGYALVSALAGASDKQFKSIVAKLEKTGELAKATLKDFTKQLGASTKESQQFAADLQKLAARGFGDLAQALAAQGDSTAMTLAHQAATGSSKDVTAANKAVGAAQSTLTGEDLTNALLLLSTLRGGTGRGYADLIAAGLDPATIKALVPKMVGQIKALPAQYRETFARQWAAQGGVAMAAGGILSRPTVVLGGEAGVRESWIPWTPSARSKTLLATTAAAMGYALVPAGRYRSAASTAAVAREVTKHIEVHLHGAKQSSAEQAHDIARRISFVG